MKIENPLEKVMIAFGTAVAVTLIIGGLFYMAVVMMFGAFPDFMNDTTMMVIGIIFGMSLLIAVLKIK